MEEGQQSGWVYIMRNPSIPNMVKIGSTFNDPAERAKQLSSASGVPTPFFVVRAFATLWPREVEEYIHEDHRWRRVSPNREFFYANVESSSDMASDSDYDEYYSLVVRNAIAYCELRMKAEGLQRQLREMRKQLDEMWRQHDRELLAFSNTCQKTNYPEKWAQYQEQLRLLRKLENSQS